MTLVFDFLRRHRCCVAKNNRMQQKLVAFGMIDETNHYQYRIKYLFVQTLVGTRECPKANASPLGIKSQMDIQYGCQ